MANPFEDVCQEKESLSGGNSEEWGERMFPGLVFPEAAFEQEQLEDGGHQHQPEMWESA